MNTQPDTNQLTWTTYQDGSMHAYWEGDTINGWTYIIRPTPDRTIAYALDHQYTYLNGGFESRLVWRHNDPAALQRIAQSIHNEISCND